MLWALMGCGSTCRRSAMTSGKSMSYQSTVDWRVDAEHPVVQAGAKIKHDAVRLVGDEPANYLVKSLGPHRYVEDLGLCALELCGQLRESREVVADLGEDLIGRGVAEKGLVRRLSSALPPSVRNRLSCAGVEAGSAMVMAVSLLSREVDAPWPTRPARFSGAVCRCKPMGVELNGRYCRCDAARLGRIFMAQCPCEWWRHRQQPECEYEVQHGQRSWVRGRAHRPVGGAARKIDSDSATIVSTNVFAAGVSCWIVRAMYWTRSRYSSRVRRSTPSRSTRPDGRPAVRARSIRKFST